MKSYTAQTYSIKPNDVQKKWIVVDATDKPLGRLASRIANALRGKNKAYYTPNVDCGDNVIVVNAEKVKLTGTNKGDTIRYRHTGFPGGIKSRSFDQILEGKFPERLLQHSVKRMLPKESPLAREQLKNLYVYAGSEHPHAGQQPVLVNLLK